MGPCRRTLLALTTLACGLSPAAAPPPSPPCPGWINPPAPATNGTCDLLCPPAAFGVSVMGVAEEWAGWANNTNSTPGAPLTLKCPGLSPCLTLTLPWLNGDTVVDRG